jgi:hypothetical protein
MKALKSLMNIEWSLRMAIIFFILFFTISLVILISVNRYLSSQHKIYLMDELNEEVKHIYIYRGDAFINKKISIGNAFDDKKPYPRYFEREVEIGDIISKRAGSDTIFILNKNMWFKMTNLK